MRKTLMPRRWKCVLKICLDIWLNVKSWPLIRVSMTRWRFSQILKISNQTLIRAMLRLKLTSLGKLRGLPSMIESILAEFCYIKNRLDNLMQKYMRISSFRLWTIIWMMGNKSSLSQIRWKIQQKMSIWLNTCLEKVW